MKSILRQTLFALTGVLFVSSQAFAVDLGVEASVANNCVITTSPVVFGAYDPIVTNKTAAVNLNGAIHITCTEGSTAAVSLDLGANAAGAVRNMTNGTSMMVYELYTATGRTVVWNTTNTVAATGTGANQDLTVFGRLPAGQSTVTAGNYADTVVATFNF